jgi:hypothetical protein
VRAALALLMLPLIPVHAVLVCVAYPVALVVTSGKPVAPGLYGSASPPDTLSGKFMPSCGCRLRCGWS